ncbi:MAG: purine-nucleoside phosphorylase [Pyrinomonadaceae bacterium]|nr:purine-nucleoside phosphorylase [Pyrinomonadaceae bacterium]
MIYEKALEAAQFIRGKYNKQIDIALVLGSGLGAFAEEIENRITIPYHEIPHFARSTVEGHAGKLVIGEVSGVKIAVQQGRFHYYEGYALEEVTFPMRVFGLLDIKNLILTNAAGSLNADFGTGSLMLIRDHINMMGVNPLRGKNDERFGTRFPDMTAVYSRDLQELAIAEANAMDLSLRRGVYCALSGPSYETPAEIKMLRYIGADAVGMSTVPEAIVAKQQGMRILAISCISNAAAGMSDDNINHTEVMETGAKIARVFTELIKRVVVRMNTISPQMNTDEHRLKAR